jgi:hypothetical protein
MENSTITAQDLALFKDTEQVTFHAYQQYPNSDQLCLEEEVVSKYTQEKKKVSHTLTLRSAIWSFWDYREDTKRCRAHFYLYGDSLKIWRLVCQQLKAGDELSFNVRVGCESSPVREAGIVADAVVLTVWRKGVAVVDSVVLWTEVTKSEYRAVKQEPKPITQEESEQAA